MTTKLRAASFQDGAVTTTKIAADAITNAKIADDAITNAKIADDAVQTENFASTVNLGRRNIIINGAMQVAQRGADNLNITAASGGAYACDRFKLYLSLGGTAQFDLQQVSEAPTGSGFSKSLKLSCDVTDTLTANNYLFLTYRIEGQDVQHLKKGTSSAESVTLSFWLKSNKATSGQVNLRDTQNSRMISKTYTVSAADTWQYITLTFDGDTSGVLTNDNANRLAIEFFLDSGTTYSSGSTNTSWGTTSNGDRNATNFGLVSSTSNYWQITGVQLEVGSQVTPFEHRSFGEELALCQRYFQKTGEYSIAPSNGSSTSSFSSFAEPLGTCVHWGGTDAGHCPVYLAVTMRVKPTVVRYGNSNGYLGYISSGSSAPSSDNSLAFHQNLFLTANTEQMIGLNNQVTGNTVWGVKGGFTADAEL